MTKLLIPGLFFLATIAAAQQARPQCRAADRAARWIAQDWKAAYNAGDAARVAALYTEDADYLTQHYVSGIVHGRALIRAYVQRGIDAHYHIDSIDLLSTGCSAGLAYSVARYRATNGGEKVLGVNLVVIRKIGSQWRIVAHEAAVPDPRTAVQHLGTYK